MKPEERILNALIEGIEATGEIITPEKRKRMRCFFNMGYSAGHSISSAEKAEIEELGLPTVEETIEDFIEIVNKLVFTKIAE